MDVSSASSKSYQPAIPARSPQAQQNFSDMVRSNTNALAEVAQGASREEIANSIWHDVKETSLSDASDAVRAAFDKMDSPDRPEGLTDSQWLTQLTANLGATDSTYADMALSEQESPERYISGEAPDIMKVNFQGHTFTFAGKIMDMSLMKVASVTPDFLDLKYITPPKS